MQAPRPIAKVAKRTASTHYFITLISTVVIFVTYKWIWNTVRVATLEFCLTLSCAHTHAHKCHSKNYVPKFMLRPYHKRWKVQNTKA